MVISWMFVGVRKQARLAKISSTSAPHPLNFSNVCGLPIFHDILTAIYQKIQVAIPDKIGSFIVDQVHIPIRPNIEKVQSMFDKVLL